MIEIINVSKSFGTFQAVDKISFSIGKGEIFGILGPNGAGKSTTIRMILNILSRDSGDISIGGHHLTEKDKEKIGYLPEERGLYKKAVIGELLVYLCELKGMKRTEAVKSVDNWLTRFGLLEWKKKKTDVLSKGMAQKVQLIATVAFNPDILILDEPFSGLDPVSVDEMRAIVLELQMQGKTILFSTHIMENAEKLCSRIILINKGKEVLSGAVSEIKRGFGKNTVALEFDGDAETVKNCPAFSRLSFYPRYAEAELALGKTPDDALKYLIEKVSIRRFEVLEPSLHQIFVDKVGGTHA